MSISIDFVRRWFPYVKGFDLVMVVVDRFSMYVVFKHVPRNCTVEIAIEEFYCKVLKLFEFPIDIMSDTDAHFTGIF